MDDVLNCPVCGNKLRNIWLEDKHLYGVTKTANYVERTCAQARNHSIQFFTDEATGKVDLVKISLNSKYSKYLEIDYVNKKCKISCMKAGKIEHINIDKMLELDFPNLTKLKEKVNLYVFFS